MPIIEHGELEKLPIEEQKTVIRRSDELYASNGVYSIRMRPFSPPITEELEKLPKEEQQAIREQVCGILADHGIQANALRFYASQIPIESSTGENKINANMT